MNQLSFVGVTFGGLNPDDGPWYPTWSRSSIRASAVTIEVSVLNQAAHKWHRAGGNWPRSQKSVGTMGSLLVSIITARKCMLSRHKLPKNLKHVIHRYWPIPKWKFSWWWAEVQGFQPSWCGWQWKPVLWWAGVLCPVLKWGLVSFIVTWLMVSQFLSWYDESQYIPVYSQTVTCLIIKRGQEVPRDRFQLNDLKCYNL